METLNCIGRLHYIINEFNNTNTVNTVNFESVPLDELNQVLSRLFGIDKDNPSEVFSTYAGIFELCNDCFNTIDKIAPADESSSKNEFMKSKIQNAMSALSVINLPDGNFKNFKSILNNDTLSNLKMLSYLLPSSEKILTEHQLDKIYNDVNLILDEVINADINIKLKDILINRINDILIIVRKYKIYGSDEILKAYETSIGSIYMNSSIIEEADKPFCKSMFSKLIKTISFLSETVPLVEYVEKLIP